MQAEVLLIMLLDMSLNSLLTFSKKNQNDIVSSVFPLKGLNSKFFLDYINLNLKLAIPAIDVFKQYIYGIYTYHSSEYSNIKIKRYNENYYIDRLDLNKNLNQSINYYSKKLIKIPFTSKRLLQGNDNHIGGSFTLEKY